MFPKPCSRAREKSFFLNDLFYFGKFDISQNICNSYQKATLDKVVMPSQICALLSANWSLFCLSPVLVVFKFKSRMFVSNRICKKTVYSDTVIGSRTALQIDFPIKRVLLY